MYKYLKQNWEYILLVVFIVIASVLRFYNITKLQFFTYDQARDALFVKRMIVDHEFRLLGTQTSLPGMYLPPFYYYTIAPILWIFSLNPVGIDIYSALIGVLSVPLVFFVGNKIFGRPAGIFSAGLFAVSPIVVELTRRAWNCNTLPFFILITFYFVYSYFKEKKVRDLLSAFVFYGYCLSLHFGAWTLLPLFVGIWLFRLVQEVKLRGLRAVRDLGVLGGLGILGLFVSPLLIFELRHNFFLVSQAKVFFFDGGHLGPVPGNFLESLISSLTALFTILISGKIAVGYGAPLEFTGRIKDLLFLSQPISVVAQKPFSISFQWWGGAIFLLMVFVTFKYFKKFRLPLALIWIWIIWGVLVSRLYGGKFFFFYYLFLFPAPILLFGFLGKKLFAPVPESPAFQSGDEWKSIWGFRYGVSDYKPEKPRLSSRGVFTQKLLKPLVLFSFLLIIAFHWRYTTVFTSGWRGLMDLKLVAKEIAENVSEGKTFNLATIQRDLDRWDRNSVDYRYFVETFEKKRALGWYPQDYKEADELFVIDETGRTDVLQSNIMEIEKFKPQKILGSWSLPKGIVVYKLGK